VSTSRFLAILCFSAALYAQAPQFDPRHFNRYDDFGPGVPPPSASLAPDWPEPQARQPISGVVSLGELQHPVPKKALRAAYDAQRLTNANKIPQAIAKLEKTIRIAPSYRDAHCNLGVLYARVGRIADARAEFQKALAIGPPAAPIYADLALVSVDAGEFGQAEVFARKALELDPTDSAARLLLEAGPD
jgi:tetratricopeptide (TPR) repeat protein